MNKYNVTFIDEIKDENGPVQIIKQTPTEKKESIMNMGRLLEDFEENERRVYGFNQLHRAEKFIDNMKKIDHSK